MNKADKTHKPDNKDKADEIGRSKADNLNSSAFLLSLSQKSSRLIINIKTSYKINKRQTVIK